MIYTLRTLASRREADNHLWRSVCPTSYLLRCSKSEANLVVFAFMICIQVLHVSDIPHVPRVVYWICALQNVHLLVAQFAVYHKSNAWESLAPQASPSVVCSSESASGTPGNLTISCILYIAASCPIGSGGERGYLVRSWLYKLTQVCPS